MALDDKTLQALEASRPPGADDFCPECGRPWADPAPSQRGGPAAIRWRGLFLIVVGVALALAFGVRAASAHRTEAAIQRNVANWARCLNGVAGIQPCPASEQAAVQLAASGESLDVARGQRDRALGGAALGLLALAAGLGVLVRRPRPATAAGRGAAETVLAVAGLQFLAVYVSGVAIQVAAGQPLSAQTLDRAADQILGVLSLLWRS